MNFTPYNYNQLIKIVQSRLVGTDLFKPEAIELCARKVGSVSGDARRALEICRYAISITEKDALKNSSSSLDKVDVNVILRAIKELNASPTLLALHGASLHQMIFLASIIKQIRKGGLSDVDFDDVLYEHLRICTAQAVEHPTFTQLQSLAFSLAHFGWVIMENKRHGLSKRVLYHILKNYNINLDSIEYNGRRHNFNFTKIKRCGIEWTFQLKLLAMYF